MKTHYLKFVLLLFTLFISTSCEKEEDEYIPPYVADLIKRIWIDRYTINDIYYEQELVFNKDGDGSDELYIFYPNGRIDKEIYYFNWKYIKTETIRIEYSMMDIIFFDIEELTGNLLKGYLDGEYVEFTPR